MQIMTAKNNDHMNALRHVILNGVILICDIVPYARHLLPVKFFPKY